MDTGPDSRSLIRNIQSMKTKVEDIERVVISHWHSDHTGGLLSFLDYRNNIIHTHDMDRNRKPIVIDVHPDRPLARGIALAPDYEKVIARLPDDPSLEAIRNLSGSLETHSTGHLVADNTVYVSGEIPRITSFEEGLLSGARWIEDSGKGEWIKEQVVNVICLLNLILDCIRIIYKHLMDERYVLVDVIGKGLVIFSAYECLTFTSLAVNYVFL